MRSGRETGPLHEGDRGSGKLTLAQVATTGCRRGEARDRSGKDLRLPD